LIEIQVNNLHSRIDKKKASKEEINFVHSILSVQVPGAYFSKMYKMHLWDGKKHFFNRLTCQFYTGLVPFIVAGLQAKGIPAVVNDLRVKPEPKIHALELHGISLRNYQERMIQEALAAGRGVIAGATNSGKTECAAGIIQILGLPALFLTHRIGLLEQTHERFELRLNRPIGWLGAGVRDLKDINIISVPTLHKRLADEDEEIVKLVKETPVVIIDECHRSSARTFEECLKLSGAYYRFGLSATPFHRDDVSNLLVRGLLGDTVTAVSNTEMIEWGFSAKPTVYLIPVYVPDFTVRGKKGAPYETIYDEAIVFNNYRNEAVAKSAKHFLDKGKSVFVMVWRIDHGTEIERWMHQYGIETTFISGQTPAKHNTQILKQFKQKEIKCVISSSISDEGIDVPAMDVLIICPGDKSPLKTIQRVGRSLRKKVDVPNVVTVIDFVDFTHRHLLNHARERCSVYVKEKFKIYEVTTPDWDKIEEKSSGEEV